MGSNVQWSFSIQGNGLAASGLVEVRFLVEDGDFFDWNTTVDSISGPSRCSPSTRWFSWRGRR